MLPKTCQRNICLGAILCNFKLLADVFLVDLFQISYACHVYVNKPSGSQSVWQRKVFQGNEGEEIQVVSPERGVEILPDDKKP